MEQLDENMDINFGDVGGVDISIDLNSFDGMDVISEDALQNRYIKPKAQVISSKFVKYENAQKFARDHKLDKGERIDAIVAGNFIFGDYVEAYLTHHDIAAQKMTISTLSLSQENVDSLYNLMEHGYIDELNMIVSAYFYAYERRNLIPYMRKNLDIDNRFQLAVAGVHTKTCQFIDEGGRKLSFMGARIFAHHKMSSSSQSKKIHSFTTSTTECSAQL
jgi:hypothetical protein